MSIVVLLVQALIEAADQNGDGTIDYEEFSAAVVAQSKLENDEVIAKAFRHFDADGSGLITADEVAAVLKVGRQLLDLCLHQQIAAWLSCCSYMLQYLDSPLLEFVAQGQGLSMEEVQSLIKEHDTNKVLAGSCLLSYADPTLLAQTF